MIARDAKDAFVDQLLERYRVIAPTERADELVFDQVNSGDEVVLDYRNTKKSPKSAFFPQTECTIRFQRQVDRYNEIEATPVDETPTVLLGMRPCDARALLVMDRVFAQGIYTDPYYKARRDNTMIVTLACDHPRRNCFCHAFDSHPYDREGADIMMREAGDAYLLEGVSGRGTDLLAELELEKADLPHLEKAGEIETEARERLAEMEAVSGIDTMLPELFESEMWQEVAEKCIACGTCTYICPTCHCFNIEDRVRADEGERVRAWDSCMYSTFTTHASGHNPRPDQAARWRQRAMHKFEYLPRNVGLYGCVGCGRCVLNCPVQMDIRDVLQRVRQEHASETEKVGE